MKVVGYTIKKTYPPIDEYDSEREEYFHRSIPCKNESEVSRAIEIAKSDSFDGKYDITITSGQEPPTTEERVSDLEEQLVQADEVSISLYEALQEQETINIQQDEALVDADETAISLFEYQQEQETINAQQDEALMEIYEMLG